MNIIKSSKFNTQLKEILYYIALDSKSSAKHFKNSLIEQIKNLSNMPFKFRKSIYFEDENIRDLIFKGYTIVYMIDQVQELIIIIGIKKYQNSL